MKKLDKISNICNAILTVLYVPLSLFSYLLYMASEATMDANNPLFISLINVFCVITLLIPLMCFAGIAGSMLLRKNGRSVSSFIVQFIPMVIFVLNNLLLKYAESLPPKI
jgi:Na+-driven multidrug efflux pump